MTYIQRNNSVNIIGLVLLLFAGMAASSCKKFLSEPPSKTTSLVVTTTDQLNALLDNYKTFYTEPNITATYGTDDNGLSTNLYDAGPGLFYLYQVEYSTWDVQYSPYITTDNFWSGEYAKIFTANLVLSSVDKVTGSDEDKADLTADAHFIRAYSYWVLANTYCLPYTDANKNEPGLPLKTSTSFDEPVARAPLSQVYAFIEAELTEALKTTVHLVQNGQARHWRANTAAVNGFAARYYLNRGDYTQALKYAGDALAEYSQLVDYNTGMYFERSETLTIDGGTPNEREVTIQFPYTETNQTNPTDMLAWKEFLYFRMLDNGTWWFIPSQSLLNLYDQAHDLRYKYHMVQNFSYDRGMTNPSYSYPGYIFFFLQWIPSGPTTAEMYLIKAECLARTGDVGGAMAAANTLYVKRTLPGTTPLSASSQNDAIRVVLEERRREMPFTQRWFDIRRYNNNDDPNDDVVLSRTFYSYTASAVNTGTAPIEYTLPVNSRKFAAPIPNTEITSSRGAIKQNTY